MLLQHWIFPVLHWEMLVIVGSLWYRCIDGALSKREIGDVRRDHGDGASRNSSGCHSREERGSGEKAWKTKEHLRPVAGKCGLVLS